MQDDLDHIDITGYEVEATDGAIGKVDDVMRGEGEAYIVIDTGPWIFGKQMMLPGGIIERIDRDQETIYVAYTKEVIENAPEFEASASDYEDRRRLDAYYSRLPGGPDIDPKNERRLYPE